MWGSRKLNRLDAVGFESATVASNFSVESKRYISVRLGLSPGPSPPGTSPPVGPAELQRSERLLTYLLTPTLFVGSVSAIVLVFVLPVWGLRAPSLDESLPFADFRA